MEDRIKQYQQQFKPLITKVNDHIYHFFGFGHSNAIAIIGDTSIILVDSLDSDQRAERLKLELQKITDKKVETIIFTHSHPDHRGGSGAFKDTVKQVIMHAPVKPNIKYFEKIQDECGRRGRYQFGFGLTDEELISQGLGIREGYMSNDGKYNFLAPTTILKEKETVLNIDGVELKIVSVPGETDDTILIYLEKDQVIMTGDNYYECFPNLYAIRGTQYRDVATWVDSLNEILSYDVCWLLPGHMAPIHTKEEIQKKVGNFKDMIEYILINTLDCLNQGYTIDETVQKVRLPEQYQNDPLLGEFYGTVEWSVKSIYNGYVGWFDGNATSLLPIPQKEYNQVLLELIGYEKVVERIHQAMEVEEYQLALQLLELVNEPKLKKICLLERAKQVTSVNARHYYQCSAKEIEK